MMHHVVILENPMKIPVNQKLINRKLHVSGCVRMIHLQQHLFRDWDRHEDLKLGESHVLHCQLFHRQAHMVEAPNCCGRIANTSNCPIEESHQDRR